MLKTLLLVGFGGFFGSISRFLVQQSLQRIFETVFPIGTLGVNIIGSFLIGIIYALASKGNVLSPEIRIFSAIGFCGSFTTFSTFSLDGLTLIRDSGLFYVFLYAGLSVFLGFLAAYGGIIVGRSL